jgi:uncharacterized ParB-like nuclease family protein
MQTASSDAFAVSFPAGQAHLHSSVRTPTLVLKNYPPHRVMRKVIMAQYFDAAFTGCHAGERGKRCREKKSSDAMRCRCAWNQSVLRSGDIASDTVIKF